MVSGEYFFRICLNFKTSELLISEYGFSGMSNTDYFSISCLLSFAPVPIGGHTLIPVNSQLMVSEL